MFPIFFNFEDEVLNGCLDKGFKPLLKRHTIGRKYLDKSINCTYTREIFLFFVCNISQICPNLFQKCSACDLILFSWQFCQQLEVRKIEGNFLHFQLHIFQNLQNILNREKFFNKQGRVKSSQCFFSFH